MKIFIDLKLKPVFPWPTLFHGTSEKSVQLILKKGIDKMNRQHVHLSISIDIAREVGIRHGRVVIFKVNSGKMHHDGYKFYKSDNNVWLTDNVPPKYLELLKPTDFMVY